MANYTSLEIKEGLLEQGSFEKRAWTADCSLVSDAVDSVESVTVYDETEGDTDVTLAKMASGSNSANGLEITTKLLNGLVQGHYYRIEIVWNEGSQQPGGFLRIFCPR